MEKKLTIKFLFGEENDISKISNKDLINWITNKNTNFWESFYIDDEIKNEIIIKPRNKVFIK